MRLTPAQVSFTAGQLSPLMYNRFDTEGHQQGCRFLENMLPDSRGPIRSRAGSQFVAQLSPYTNGRVMAFPVNDNFFYTGIFVETRLIIGSLIGHNPAVAYTTNSNFVQGNVGWVTGTDGNNTSIVTFINSKCILEVADQPNRFAYTSQNFTLPGVPVDYRVTAVFNGNADMIFDIGTTENGAEIASFTVNPGVGQLNEVVSFVDTDVWITARIDSDGVTGLTNTLSFYGVTDEIISDVEFTTPYLDADVSTLQLAVVPEGTAIYILHESYPPYKLTYDRITDAFSFAIVVFTAPPAEWTTGSYPSTGDFFEGRLWLGGTVNEPQTFWGSVSGVPEDFTLGVEADDALQFTMSKFGRIEWIVGFKNLLIGTKNAEHIVTSDLGLITPTDINVEQQSAYGSANIQPVQVGDQVFYVSADRRKLRAIQYEWQADNWLSRDLTFNSEDITAPGIRHIVWQQNPHNNFICVLEDGSAAVMVYDRSNNVYGWSKLKWGGGGRLLDATIGPLQGTDFVNILVTYASTIINFETQTSVDEAHFMDSWIDRAPDVPDGLIVSGLDHLDGFDCRVLVDGAVHPNETPVGGEITLQFTGLVITVGQGYSSKVITLPVDRGSPMGTGVIWKKRFNKIYVRILNSIKPLINGERPAERFPSTPMDTPQPGITEDVQVINLGFSETEPIEIEQDLPFPLAVVGIYGQLEQDIT